MKTALCPRCEKPAVITEENPCRPFCSERCRTLDLGGWLTEKFRIPGNAAEPDSSDPTSDEDGELPN